jgi:hypothetical protein
MQEGAAALGHAAVSDDVMLQRRAAGLGSAAGFGSLAAHQLKSVLLGAGWLGA